MVTDDEFARWRIPGDGVGKQSFSNFSGALAIPWGARLLWSSLDLPELCGMVIPTITITTIQIPAIITQDCLGQRSWKDKYISNDMWCSILINVNIYKFMCSILVLNSTICRSRYVLMFYLLRHLLKKTSRKVKQSIDGVHISN